jgi:hypothetical protein
VVEVEVYERRQLRRQHISPEHLVIQHIVVALSVIDAEVGVTCQGEIPREQPRRTGKGSQKSSSISILGSTRTQLVSTT